MPRPAPAPSSHFTVRDNFITLHCSDANSSVRPNAELHPVVRNDGSIDYMHECVGDDPVLTLWKTKIGSFLAEFVLHLPEVRGRKKYILANLPKGYGLFVHKKGDRYNPRMDAYLWGSGSVFRSPAEFFLHAKWILLGCPKPDPLAPPHPDEELWGPQLPEEFTDRCGCKYCAGTNQTYISNNFSNYCPQKNKKVRREARSAPFVARFEGVHPQGR